MGIEIYGSDKAERVSWCLGILLMMMLVVGVEVNPGPLVEQDKIDQILKQVKNQKEESKVIQKLSETHTRETGEVKKGIKNFE